MISMLREIKLDFSQIATVLGGLILLAIGIYLTYLITTTNSGRIDPMIFAPTALIIAVLGLLLATSKAE